ncbi:MAG: hypothetical protein ACPG19_08040 [Saprospiraceae bacterium]
MKYQGIYLTTLIITISIFCNHCYICDPGFAFKTNVIFIDEVTGEDLFFGDNAQFAPEEIEIDWGICTTEERQRGSIYADTASFSISMNKRSCGVIRYPDGSLDTIRIDAYKVKCNFREEVFFNEELLEEHYGTPDNPIELIKN